MTIAEILEGKLKDRARIDTNVRRLRRDVMEAELSKDQCAQLWKDEESHYQRQRHEEERFRANSRWRELKELSERELPLMQAALDQIDRELPGLHHRVEAQMQAESVELYLTSVEQLCKWFDLGFEMVERLDSIRATAAAKWPAAVEYAGLPTLPAAAGLPRAAEALLPIFGLTGREGEGIAALFKRTVGEWNIDSLDPADPVRLQVEHRREVEAEGERQTQARIADMREHARVAAPGVTAATLSPPKQSIFGKWFSGGRPSVAETDALTDDKELEQARAQLGRASARLIDVDSARYRGEATQAEADQARAELDRAKRDFEQAEARAVLRL
jgi:hypothetical protein